MPVSSWEGTPQISNNSQSLYESLSPECTLYYKRGKKSNKQQAILLIVRSMGNTTADMNRSSFV